MKNWKTTALGVLTILGALINSGHEYLSGQPVGIPMLLTGLTTGLGLIHASDAADTAKPEAVKA